MKKQMMKILGVLAISSIVLLGSGCGESNRVPKKCEWCGGMINWHKIGGDYWSDSYALEYEEDDEGFYHKWCFKLK